MSDVVLIVGAYVYLIGGVVFFALKREDYSHVRDSISELAEIGSSYEKTVSYGVFLPFGLVAILVAIQLSSLHPVIGLLLGAMGVSYALSAFFPCDPNTPAIGTWKNVVHNVIGGGCYAAALYSVHELGDSSLAPLATVSLVLLCAMLVTFVAGWPRQILGFIQRLAETSLFALILVGLLWPI